jgi:ATP-binding cassette subfamily B protein
MEEVTIVPLKRRFLLSLRMLKTTWHIRPGGLVLFFAGALLEVVAFILSIYATARLGALLAGFVTSGNTDGIWFWLWVDIAAGLVIAFGYLLMAYSKKLMYFAWSSWSTNQFLKALCTMDLNNFYDETTRNQINKVGNAYTWQLPNLSDANLDLIYGLLRFVAITLVVAQVTWWLVPVIAIFLIPTLITEGKLAKLLWFVWDQKGDQRHIYWGLDWILRQAKGQMELRSTQASEYVLGKIDTMNSEFYSEQETKLHHANRLLIPTKVLEASGTAIGAVYLLKQFLNRSISLEKYFFLSGALIRVGGALNNIFGTLSRMQEGLLFADSYFKLLDLSPTILNHTDAVSAAKTTPEIVFENLSFNYPGKDTPIFEKLNLTIKAGEHLALVGENGAGKTTLIKLLLRFYKPTAGRILIDGVDLQHISIESWYTNIATLFQDFNMYPLPIDENIQIGRSKQKPDNQLLETAAHFGGVTSFVKRYTHGWDTVLDSSFKKGVEPSGGQWQRVALARAFYRQANVLVLDEPTSAIDAKAEYDIFNNIFEHYRDKTTIIVSHRFSTVRRADRIVVLDKGKIVEEGSHAQLMKNKRLYHEMFTKQAEGYK